MVRRRISSPVGRQRASGLCPGVERASAGIPPLGVCCHGQGPSVSELPRHVGFCTMDSLFARVDCVACPWSRSWGWGGTRTSTSDLGSVTLYSGRRRAAGA